MDLKEEYKELLASIYSYVTANEEVLKRQEVCTCLHCSSEFSFSEIDTWLNDSEGRTAVCPICGIDAVVPYELPESEIRLTKELKDDLKEVYF